MSILVINAGSTSVKFAQFDANLKLILKGGIFQEESRVKFKLNGEEVTSSFKFNEFDNFISENLSSEPKIIGYRVVHGGENFIEPTVISSDVLIELKALFEIAPLHNPPAVHAIEKLMKRFPNQKHIAVFDTAFHFTIPEKAYLYGLPYSYYKDYKIRRYGFHGISYDYVSHRVKTIDNNLNKIIICHLGGGSSVCAVENFRSVDTSMGFSPLEGALMATRSGDVDDSVILYLSKKLNLTLEQLLEIENKKSGLLGISEKSSDMLTLINLAKNNDRQSKLAIEIFCYKIQKIIGSYVAALNGLDALVFTAGVGEGSNIIRSLICEQLKYLNIELDENHNSLNVKEDKLISSIDSLPVWVIPTNEELQIAKSVINF